MQSRKNTTNERRHGPDLQIRANDLITAADCRVIVAEALDRYHTAVLKARADAFRALPWWRRMLRGGP